MAAESDAEDWGDMRGGGNLKAYTRVQGGEGGLIF